MVQRLAVAELIRWTLALVLAAAAGSKLTAGLRGRTALETFGIRGRRVQLGAWLALIALEAGLATAVAAEAPGAAAAAAAVLAGFAVALGVAIARGRRGAPCACFGRSSRVGNLAVVRAALLAAAFAALAAMPDVRLSATGWLAVGLGVALLGVAGLTVAVLALAREIGELRLALGPQSALSLEGEGPELGSRPGLAERFERTEALLVAIFSSAGCRMCQALEPTLRLVAREPGVALETFDEHADADVWHALGIPGSPFAVVMDDEGTVRATGTFNNLAQLESLLVAAGRELVEAETV
jgi:hypothetical protein